MSGILFALPKSRPPSSVLIPAVGLAFMTAFILMLLPEVGELFVKGWNAIGSLSILYITPIVVLAAIAGAWFIFLPLSVVALLLGRGWAGYVAIASYLLAIVSPLVVFSQHVTWLKFAGAIPGYALIALMVRELLAPSTRAFLGLETVSLQVILLHSIAAGILLASWLTLPCLALLELADRIR